MDPTEHALDDFGHAIINRGQFPLTLRELAQAPTKDSNALDIETRVNLVDSVLRPLDDLVRPGVANTWFWRQSGIQNSLIEHYDAVKSPKTKLSLKLTEVDKLWQNPQFCCSGGSFSF